MYLKKSIIILAYLISVSGFTQNIEFMVNKRRFSLGVKEDHIKLIGYQTHLSFSKNKCNERIFTRFTRGLDMLVRSLPRVSQSNKGTFKVSVDGKGYNQSSNSKIGRTFSGIFREIQRMKIEEKLLCKTEK